MSDPAPTFTNVLDAAANLHTPGDAALTPEYTRGQAELICDMFDISADHKQTIAEVISHQHTATDALLATLQAWR